MNTHREAFTAGWNASKRTTTYDLEAAEQRYEKKHGTSTGTAFAAGWTAYAAGSHNSLKLAWLAHEQERNAQAKADDLTPAGVQLAIDAELAQADAELAGGHTCTATPMCENTPCPLDDAIGEPVERPRSDAGIPPGPDNPPLNQLWTRGDDWTRLIGLAERASSMANSTPGLRALNRIDYLTEIIEQAERMRAGEVDNARSAGESWQAIGAQLGSTKQAAQQRYGKKP